MARGGRGRDDAVGFGDVAAVDGLASAPRGVPVDSDVLRAWAVQVEVGAEARMARRTGWPRRARLTRATASRWPSRCRTSCDS
ncbi:hypothetical protein BGK72_38885 [Streptomyces agglomeratus]|nr:hypothetical protein BGK72_38885 [Streptomyces agglomeratus]